MIFEIIIFSNFLNKYGNNQTVNTLKKPVLIRTDFRGPMELQQKRIGPVETVYVSVW